MSHFFNSTVLHEYQFAVIDATVSQFLPEGIPTEILIPKRMEPCAHLMPRVISLQSLSEECRVAIIECLQDTRANPELSASIVFISTSKSIQEFSRHWNSLQMFTQSTKRKFWLRAHDPRVLHQLLRVLNSKQRRWLFGPVCAFHYWIGDAWDTALRDANTPGFVPAIGPSSWDWPRIEQIGIVNRALSNAGVHDLQSQRIQGALAERLIQRAIIRHGLSDKADLVEFATRGLLTGLLFDEHPQIASAINGATSPSELTLLSDRFALVADAVWASFRQPVNPIHETRYEFSNDM